MERAAMGPRHILATTQALCSLVGLSGDDAPDDRSRMRRESHVRFWESAGVKFPRATQPSKIGRQKYARRYGLSVHMAAAFVLARRAQGFRDRYVSSDSKRRRSTREDAATPVLVAKERGVRGRAKVEPGGPSPHGDPVHTKRSEILRTAAGGIPVREGDASPSSAMRVRRAS